MNRYVDGGVSVLLVVFAGIMSGLSLGLMSMNLLDVEILRRSGSPDERKQAASVLPVLKKKHQLLVTLLLCNAGAMEALPIFLDDVFNHAVAILLSVSIVLIFGEIIPQAICSRYGLSVGSKFIWLVKILMFICLPLAYPVGKVLDRLLGDGDDHFTQAKLKALMFVQCLEAGDGANLTNDDTAIISEALGLNKKTAEEAMVSIDSIPSLDVVSKLDWDAIIEIVKCGLSEVLVYSGTRNNIVGFVLNSSAYAPL